MDVCPFDLEIAIHRLAELGHPRFRPQKKFDSNNSFAAMIETTSSQWKWGMKLKFLAIAENEAQYCSKLHI